MPGLGPRKPVYRLALVFLLAPAVIGAGLAVAVWALQYRPPQSGRIQASGPVAAVRDDLGWTTVGGDPGHLRHSALRQLTPETVGGLQPAWTYRTGEVARRGKLIRRSKFQATPILAAGNLVFCTPFNRVIALDPATGRERWVHDPDIDTDPRPANDFNCRGVASWTEQSRAARGLPCGERILTATNDRRLIALDARTGRPCKDFGLGGQVAVVTDAEIHRPGEVQIVAAPAVIGDVVVVGSSVADNRYAAAATGAVRAFDVRTGQPVWRLDPVASADGRTGGGNVWSSISADPERDLVFLPTSSPSPDFFGGGRSPDSPLTNAVLAVRASTGEIVWAFQTVHHDLWDYDVPAAPTLFELERAGRRIPALAFATKAGFLFVLDRETGRPLFDVEERRVPASDVPGERASPTQPHSALPVIAPQAVGPAEAFGVLGFDRAHCARRLAAHRNEGLFTPPSTRGTILAPTTGGGANWGGVTIDPATQRLFVNSSRAAEVITLAPRNDGPASPDVAPATGSPYGVTRKALLSPLGLPCNRPPWGALTAVDLKKGRLAWETPLGTTSTLAPFGLAFPWGTPGLGGAITTSGGLLFIGAAMDNRLRVFDSRTGQALWSADLPAGGQATPMTYAVGGRQFVVIAAGGHSILDTPRGDFVVAYALPMERIGREQEGR
jgi:quinoprotein glucose dehydrogenase